MLSGQRDDRGGPGGRRRKTGYEQDMRGEEEGGSRRRRKQDGGGAQWEEGFPRGGPLLCPFWAVFQGSDVAARNGLCRARCPSAALSAALYTPRVPCPAVNAAWPRVAASVPAPSAHNTQHPQQIPPRPPPHRPRAPLPHLTGSAHRVPIAVPGSHRARRATLATTPSTVAR